ncbi:MAG: spermidine/putrescine ABC transporter substrate-binding protein [Elusimicrobia bacterium]|nr:spermidine/putrescine ABC transporter substrate-binding protein [Elusimicrobiota bacterium]
MHRLISSVLAVLVLAACANPKASEVRFYTWDSYDDPELFAEFEKKTGIKVTATYFASNEEMLAKLMGGGGGYDLITPSDYMVSIMRVQGLLADLDKAAMPNLKNVDPRFKSLYYDPEMQNCVPYIYGLTGIAYDSERVKPAPTSWAALWDPTQKGRIGMLNDQREVFALALQFLGLPASSKDPKHLEAAYAKLRDQKPLVRTYSSDNQKALLISGELALAHAWSSDVNQAAEEKPSLRFAIPKEGGFIWMDTLCAVKGSPNAAAAMKLVDFLLEPANHAKAAVKLRGGLPNIPARKFLPEELKKDPTVTGEEKLLKSLEWMHEVGEAAPVYDRFWTQLKAG